MNNFPARLVLDPETQRKLQAHCIVFTDSLITVDDFNLAIEAAKTGLQVSDEIYLRDEAIKLGDMQLWTTAQLKRLGIFPSENPTTPCC
jgi:hypothetical protein